MGLGCGDIFCCECNYKQPAWMPNATPSTTHAVAPPRELMEEISRLSQSGFRLQLVGPEGEIRTLETPVGSHSSHTAVANGRSAPALSLHESPVNSPKGFSSSRRLPLQVPERVARGPYETTSHSDPRLHYANVWSPVDAARSHGRVLPPIPDFATSQQTLTGTQSDGNVRIVLPRV